MWIAAIEIIFIQPFYSTILLTPIITGVVLPNVIFEHNQTTLVSKFKMFGHDIDQFHGRVTKVILLLVF